MQFLFQQPAVRVFPGGGPRGCGAAALVRIGTVVRHRAGTSCQTPRQPVGQCAPRLWCPDPNSRVELCQQSPARRNDVSSKFESLARPQVRFPAALALQMVQDHAPCAAIGVEPSGCRPAVPH